MRPITRTLSVLLAVSAGVFFLACDADGPTAAGPDGPVPPGPSFDRPPWAGGGNGGGGGGDDGEALAIVFPDDLAFGSFGIAATGDGATEVSGENTADGITAEGSYSLVYDVDTSTGGVCEAALHPLVALFDEVELNTANFSLRVDKEADDSGSFDLNDRVRVDLNELSHPSNPHPDTVYTVWFRGRPADPGYDPGSDVTIVESEGWTSIEVVNEDVFVRELACKNKKCKRREIVARDRCELAADYSLKVSR